MLQLAGPQPAHHRSQPFLIHGKEFTIILPRRQFQDRTRTVVTSLPSERGEPPQFGVAGLCPRSFPAGLSPLDICGQRCPPPQVKFQIARAPKARCFKQVVFLSSSPARTSCSRSRSRSSRRPGTRSASPQSCPSRPNRRSFGGRITLAQAVPSARFEDFGRKTSDVISFHRTLRQT